MEQRIESLLARMTLEEKVGQMSQSSSIRTPLSPEIQAQIRHGRWGSFLNAGSARDRATAQHIAVRESRLRIPLLFGRDVIHGYHTMFPIPLGQSASWNPELIQQAARVAAREASPEFAAKAAAASSGGLGLRVSRTRLQRYLASIETSAALLDASPILTTRG